MDILQIVIFGIISSLLFLILKDTHTSIAYLLVILTGIIILSVVITQIGAVLKLIESLGEKASIEGVYMETILKIIGIAYIAEIGANITRDAGLKSIASKIELAGKVFILILAVPIISAVIEAILNFLPVS
ncbi:stage III sporulation protein AD [Virgibacillus flavescens]|uniref:stage III sporulation protein AD n=1 Tax=Virgibacillus flavescens TaxID=1611422 RepID=UPI003D3249BC